MSELHKAVQAEIAIHTPTVAPPFAVLTARRRARNRRRTGAAAVVSALAVAAIAIVPSMVTNGSTAPSHTAAAGDRDLFDFSVQATDPTNPPAPGRVAVNKCLALPGISQVGLRDSYPEQYGGRVTGRHNAGALKACVGAAAGWAVTLVPVSDTTPAPRTPPVAGDPATWRVDESRPPGADDRTFTALVSRIRCSGGVTGEVFAPAVVETAEEVVVTFTVVPIDPGPHPCPGNDQVPYEVTLSAPLGQRALIDGTCVPPSARTRAFCDAPRRWPLP
ncbi:hypothetical protein [Kineosporia sp. R_H_3]|uniref:hypothetical protein n=1 Tax=Kineosporia sp. R_H_3 TaxID=1961848 RepID=UPI000B4BA2CB|nr:hypothetical protein [Kineosporia sp. R_H_3]